jgi:hypothetical protein
VVFFVPLCAGLGNFWVSWFFCAILVFLVGSSIFFQEEPRRSFTWAVCPLNAIRQPGQDCPVIQAFSGETPRNSGFSGETPRNSGEFTCFRQDCPALNSCCVRVFRACGDVESLRRAASSTQNGAFGPVLSERCGATGAIRTSAAGSECWPPSNLRPGGTKVCALSSKKCFAFLPERGQEACTFTYRRANFWFATISRSATRFQTFLMKKVKGAYFCGE